jgi:tRNA (guanine-N7-)-methyltransferase
VTAPTGAVSPKGRPEGEHRSAQREGTPASPKGRPEGEHRSAQREGTPAGPDAAPVAGHRPIRSFVLRQGRLSPAQQRALDELTPRYGLAYAAGPVDFDAVFGRRAPRVLEIGCGMGETTAAIAAARPDTDFVGVEVHAPGVGSLLRQIEARSLANLRVIRHDAVDVVARMIPVASLAGIHVFFPDPWPKKRHHKRRLLQPGFVHALSLRLEPGGYLHVATDWEDYAQEVLATLEAEPLLANAAAGFAPRPAHRPLTKFEARGVKLGHGVWDLVFRRR